MRAGIATAAVPALMLSAGFLAKGSEKIWLFSHFFVSLHAISKIINNQVWV
jgi:hypothetical protein